MDEALPGSSGLVPELMADQCLINRDAAENVASIIMPYDAPGPYSVLETFTLTKDSPGLSILDTGPNALTTTDADVVSRIRSIHADMSSPAHVHNMDNDVEQRLDLLMAQDIEDWTTKTTKDTADDVNALVTTDADVVPGIQSIGADNDSSAQVYISDNDVVQRFNDAEDSATAMTTDKAGEVRVSQPDLQCTPRAQFSPKHSFAQFHEAGKGGQELKKYDPIPDICPGNCETHGSAENTRGITCRVQKQNVGHCMPSSISAQMNHAGKMGGDTANAKHSVPNSPPEQTNPDDKKKAAEAPSEEMLGNLTLTEEVKRNPGMMDEAPITTPKVYASQRDTKQSETIFEPVRIDVEVASNYIQEMTGVWLDRPILTGKIIEPKLEQVDVQQEASQNNLESPVLDSQINQTHQGVQACEKDVYSDVSLGPKRAHSAQQKSDLKGTGVDISTKPAQLSSGQDTGKEVYLDSLSSRNAVQREVRDSHRGEAISSRGNSDEYKQHSFWSSPDHNLDGLPHQQLNPPPTSITILTPSRLDIFGKDWLEYCFVSQNKLVEDCLANMSSAGFLPGTVGMAGKGSGSTVHSHPSLFPPNVPSYSSPSSKGVHSHPNMFPQASQDPIKLNGFHQESHDMTKSNILPQESHDTTSSSTLPQKSDSKANLTGSNPFASVEEPHESSKQKTLDSYFRRASNTTKEGADRNPLISVSKVRDVIHEKVENTATIQLSHDQPQSNSDTVKNATTTKPLRNNAESLHPVSNMNTPKTTSQDDADQGLGGASDPKVTSQSSNAVQPVPNIIGERNVRGIDSEGISTSASSPKDNHAGTSIVKKQGREYQTGIANPIQGPSHRAKSRTEQLFTNSNVPTDYALEGWDSHHTGPGFTEKPWTPSILGPRIDYNHLPVYNFGRPTKKQTYSSTVPAVEEETETEGKKNIELTSSGAHKAMDTENPPATSNIVENKYLPPHLRTPDKNQGSSTAKGDKSARPVQMKPNEQQNYVPPHLRVPKVASSTARSQPKVESITNEDQAQTQVHSSKASMLKDVTNTPRPAKTPQNKIENHTKAGPHSYRDSSHSAASNTMSKLSEISDTTPVPGKGKGRALELEAPIAGWNGQKPLGPPKWDNEGMYDNNDGRQRKQMQQWLDQSVVEATDSPVKVDVENASFTEGHALADGEEELSGQVDPEEHETFLPTDPFTVARAHETAEDRAQAYQQKLRDEAVESKEERRMWRQVIKDRDANEVIPPNRHKPKANIYIRPAEDRDMAQITEIYNHYVRTAVVASERTPLTIAQWRTRWHGSMDEHYAFLVAVQMSAKGPSHNRRQANELVIGFAYAEDYGDSDGVYRYTCELQFWVHHDYPCVGVGKTLVDRMIFSLDPIYCTRGGTPFVGGEDELHYMWGGRKIVAKILILIPYPADDDSNVKWQEKWLVGFDFYRVCTLPDIGHKFGKSMNVAFLSKETGSALPAGA